MQPRSKEQSRPRPLRACGGRRLGKQEREKTVQATYGEIRLTALLAPAILSMGNIVNATSLTCGLHLA